MKCNRGRWQTIVEYVLIVAIVVVTIVSVLGVFSGTVRNKLSKMAKVSGNESARSVAVRDPPQRIMNGLQPDGTIRWPRRGMPAGDSSASEDGT